MHSVEAAAEVAAVLPGLGERDLLDLAALTQAAAAIEAEEVVVAVAALILAISLECLEAVEVRVEAVAAVVALAALSAIWCVFFLFIMLLDELNVQIGNKNKDKYSGDGPNIPNNRLQGGVSDMLGNLIGEAAHRHGFMSILSIIKHRLCRFLGVNPATGKIIGAVAGNVIFQLGGKDNKLSNIGKVILDNIISGKFHRDVDPHRPVRWLLL